MNCEVVAVGTELLLGQIVDTNSTYIGEQLAAAGINCHHQTKVGDNAERIAAALRQAAARSDAVVVCGGLGPTHDDITREVLADLLGAPLELDQAIADHIQAMFASRGRTMPQNNLRQAMVPRGCEVIAQMPGTAPGLMAELPADDGRTVAAYLVPGVPREMKAMLTGTVLADLRRWAGHTDVIASRVLRTWGESESGLAERLAWRIAHLDAQGNPTLAFLASGVEGIRVRITARARTQQEVEQLLDDEACVLRDLLGQLVFSDDDQSMEQVVLTALAQRGHTLAVAERGTGGYMASRLSLAADALVADTLVADASGASASASGLSSGLKHPGALPPFAGATVVGRTRASAPDEAVIGEGQAADPGELVAAAEAVRTQFSASVGLAVSLGEPAPRPAPGVDGSIDQPAAAGEVAPTSGPPVRRVRVAVVGLDTDKAPVAGDGSDAAEPVATRNALSFSVPAPLEQARQMATITALNHLRLLLAE